MPEQRTSSYTRLTFKYSPPQGRMKKSEAIALGGVTYTVDHYGNYNSAANHMELLKLIQNTRNPRFCEYINPAKPHTLYFDIDCKMNGMTAEELTILGDAACSDVKKVVQKYFPNYTCNFITMNSHDMRNEADNKEWKYSAHITVRLYDGETPLLFSSTAAIRQTVSGMFPKPEAFFIDCGIYKEGGSLLRTIFSSKPGETRPLVPTKFMTERDLLLSFVMYHEPGSKIAFFGDLHEGMAIKTAVENKNDDSMLDLPEATDVYKKDENPIKGILFSRFLNAIIGSNTIQRELQLEYSPTKDTYRIRYKGFCVNARRGHTNNHCWAAFSHKNIRLSCFKEGCGRGRNFKVSDFIDRHDMRILMSLEVHIMTYIQEHTDIGVKKLHFSSSDIFTDVTPMLHTRYFDSKDKKQRHVISLEGYAITSSRGGILVTEFTKSRIFALFGMCFKRLQGRNVNVLAQVNNFGFLARCGGGSRKPELSPHDLVEIGEAFADNPTAMASLIFFRSETISSLYKIYETMNLSTRYRITGKSGYRRKGFLWIAEKENAMRLKILREVEEVFLELMHSTPAGFEHCTDDIEAFFGYVLTRVTNMPINGALVPLLDDILRDDTLEKVMNSNWDLLPFDNGLFNLVTNTLIQGQNNEFYSITLGYDFQEYGSTQEIDEILESIMPGLATRNYVLNYLACALCDRVPNDFCLFIIGRGCNGKSLFSRLIAETFGPLFRCVPSSIFSVKDEDPHAPKPVLQQLRHARIAILSETDEVKFRSENFKRLCGSETHSARQPHGMLEEFAMKTKFIIFGNEVPEFSSTSQALWRRLRILRFETQFVDDPKSPNERKIDRLLYRKIETDEMYRKQFMFKLIQIYRDGVKLDEPNISKELVASIRTEYDEFYEFCEEYVYEKAGGVLTMAEILRFYRQGENISTNSDVYRRYVREFSKWITDETTKFSRRTFKLGLYRFQGRPIRGWNGLAIRMQQYQ